MCFLHFDRCFNLYKDFLKQTESSLRKTRHVLEFNSGGHGGNGDDKVEDRNYTKDKDRNLSRDYKWE